jgi:hypothetical protein
MNETAGQRPTKKEQRRAMRFSVVVPVKAKWQESSGKSITESAHAKQVNAHGGLLDMKAYPPIGRQLEITNLISGEATQARVVAIRGSKDASTRGVAIEFLVPSDGFWGVNFQLRKTTAELVKVEQTIKSGGIEPRILREFRDAVDYVRKTAWAVQEWQERQLQEHDPQTVLPLLTAERIRRGTELSKAITADLAAYQVTRETIGIDEFFRAVESLHHRVADLFRDSSAPLEKTKA